MAKKRKIEILPPTPPLALQPALGIDLTKPTEYRRIVKTTEGWSTYKLDDGVTIKVRGVLVDVRRAVKQFLPDGKPLYMCQMAIVTETDAPKKQMQTKSKKRKKGK